MSAPTSPAVIRQWARDNGLPVGERGRLSPQLMHAYASSGLDGPTMDIHIPVQPTPGATGIARRITARSS